MSKRWSARIIWRSLEGHQFEKELQIDEVEELHHHIEGGPDWTMNPYIQVELSYNLGARSLDI